MEPFESILEEYPVRLQNFEGPLDLLLHLIRQHQVNVYDIPIALITQQYLEYLEIMQELDLDVAGEFLVMAATLIHVKSRMLLPRPDPTQEDPEEDPREALMRRLVIGALKGDGRSLMTLMRTRAQTQYGDAERWTEYMKPLAFGRAAKPEEIGWMAAFLASNLSAYTTGSIITIDGGGSSRRSAL